MWLKMKVTVEVKWRDSAYGYLIATIMVKNDENDKILMLDEDMYYNLDKLQDRLNTLFFNNKRFVWETATHYKKSRKLVMHGTDLKGANENGKV